VTDKKCKPQIRPAPKLPSPNWMAETSLKISLGITITPAWSQKGGQTQGN
jgi:hypothetical protein